LNNLPVHRSDHPSGHPSRSTFRATIFYLVESKG
jgi:hypothetical protein